MSNLSLQHSRECLELILHVGHSLSLGQDEFCVRSWIQLFRRLFQLQCFAGAVPKHSMPRERPSALSRWQLLVSTNQTDHFLLLGWIVQVGHARLLGGWRGLARIVKDNDREWQYYQQLWDSKCCLKSCYVGSWAVKKLQEKRIKFIPEIFMMYSL